MKYVGDGLNLLICNNKSPDLTVDFGGNENLEPSWCFHDNFLLSHHHADHFNGILKCYEEKKGCWHLNTFYFPTMPEFPDKKKFFLSLFSMNIWLNPYHPIQSSIIAVVNSLNKRRVAIRTLSKGDTFKIGQNEYEILWPPKVIEDENITKAIATAVKDFEIAAAKDDKLQKIYSRLADVSLDSFFSEPEVLKGYTKMDQETEPNELIKTANSSLRKAANRLSIAFKNADNLLFLGDLEKREIGQVVSELISKKDDYFDIVISAHHGTHFHKELLKINSDIVLASVGYKLKRYLKPEYRFVGNRFLNTFDLGDIVLKRGLF